MLAMANCRNVKYLLMVAPQHHALLLRAMKNQACNASHENKAMRPFPLIEPFRSATLDLCSLLNSSCPVMSPYNAFPENPKIEHTDAILADGPANLLHCTPSSITTTSAPALAHATALSLFPAPRIPHRCLQF